MTTRRQLFSYLFASLITAPLLALGWKKSGPIRMRTVTRQDLEALPPGVYALAGETNISSEWHTLDIMANRFVKFPESRIFARVCTHPDVPQEMPQAWARKADGNAVVVSWASPPYQFSRTREDSTTVQYFPA